MGLSTDKTFWGFFLAPKPLTFKAFQRNPQVHPQLGDNFNENFRLKVEGYLACEIAM